MESRLKFHIISSISNFLIILGAAYINQIIAEFYDEAIFAKRGHHFDFVWLCHIFILFWVYPFFVYQFKSFKKHIYLFLLSGTLLLLGSVLYDFIATGISKGFDQSELYLNAKNAFIESYSFIIIVAFGIHFNQLIFGKIWLSKYYKTHNY